MADPDVIKERVSLVNAQPTNLLVLAEKVASVKVFAAPPQQSDYVALWKPNDMKTEAGTMPAPTLVNGRHLGGTLFSRVAHKLYGFAPDPVRSPCRGVRYSRQSQVFSNPRFFRRMQLP